MTATLTPESPARPPAGRRDWAEWMLDRRWPVATAVVLVLLAAWQTYGVIAGLPEYILTPFEIAGSVGELLASGRLVDLTSASLGRLVTGFLLGTTSGVLIGLLAGVSRWLGDVVDGAVGFTYPIPKITLLPILAIWLGFTDSTRILVIAVAVFFPAYINANAATRSVDQELVWVAKNAGAGTLRTVLQVVLPAALPRTVAGIRQSLALSFIFMFATEAIGSSTGADAGLGGEMFAARANGEYDVLWAALVTVAVLGGTIDAGFRWLVGRLMRGQELEVAGG